MVSAKSRIVSCILKTIVILSAAAGTVLSAYAGRQAFMGGGSVFMFFTIQSNIAIALICAVGAVLLMTRGRAGGAWYVIKFVGTVSITLTGAVFCFILAPTMGAAAWNVQNILTHVVVPVLSVADFFAVGIYGDIKKQNAAYIVLPPLAYVVYAGIGYVLGWQFSRGVNYPYFFLNWGSPAGAFGFSGELPFMGCVWWILILLILLILVGFLYLCILDALKKRAGVNEKTGDGHPAYKIDINNT